MLTLLRPLVLAIVAIAVSPAAASAAFETRAGAAYVLDVTTNTVLLEKQADVPLPPASMSKLMTLYMLFEALRDNENITLETRFPVSSRAKAMQGSTMYLDERDRPTVRDLIQGIIVQSGNDATVVVAEGLAGTEDAFARAMNERAAALGLTNTTLTNASGWPSANHRMSVRDLGNLSAHIITDFPEYYGYFAQTEFDYDGRAPQNRFNRNPLLNLGIGADGLKTGHTSEAGYGIVGSAVQGTRRIVFVLTGIDTQQARAEEAERVVNWAFRQFVERKVAEKGERVTDAPVWLGDRDRVALVAAETVTLLIPATQRDAVEARVVYSAPIEAPIAAGQPIAELVVSLEGLPDRRIPLVADRPVARGGFLPQIRTAAGVLLRDLVGEARALR